MPIETPAWVRHAVFYQVFPDRLAASPRVAKPGPLEPWAAPPTAHGFKGGDLLGVVEHLDRLRELGITALYLNPVFTSASNHRYHTDDYLHVDPLLGGDAALRELLDEAHARGMRVILDGVFNHCGRGFWPFHHVAENGHHSPFRAWFHLDAGVLEGRRSLRAYPSEEELAARDRIMASGAPGGWASRHVLGYEAWWDLPPLPKLNLDEPHMRAHILDVAERWVRFGIDGWRLDVPEEVDEGFWREFHARVRSVDPDAYLVGEVWRPKPEWLAGGVFDAYMDYPLLEAIVGFVSGPHLDRSSFRNRTLEEDLHALDGPGFAARVMELDRLYDPAVQAVQLNLLGSHDTPRVRTMCGGDLDSVRLAMLAQMTLPGAPCVYYGDEIGLEGGQDPLCRAGFPTDQASWRDEPYGWLADLIAARHSSRALRDGALTMLHAEGMAVAWLREHGPDAFVVLINAADEPLAWEVDLPGGCDGVDVVHLRETREPAPRATHRSDGGSRTRLQLDVGGRQGAIVRIRGLRRS